MKVLVVGLGSMGQRRIRLLRQIEPNCLIYAVESAQSRRDEAAKMLNVTVYETITEAEVVSYDCAIISTSPLSHSEIIKQLIPYNFPIFTELNLVSDGYDIFKTLENRLFLSSTLLYRRDIQYIQNRVNKKRVNYNYHVGQYLPDWHPWESYKDYFVGDKRTNGCREIMAIDLPWLISCFGKIVQMHILKDKMTKLEVAYNDNYILMFEHETGARGTVCVDIVSRKSVRRLEVFSEDLHIFWEGTPQSLKEYDFVQKTMKEISIYEETEQNKNYSEDIIEDAYRDELKAFMQMVQNGNRDLVKYSFTEDDTILQLIDKIEG